MNRRFRIVLIAAVLLLVFAVVGPKPSAERFRAQVKQGLERSLQRNVEIGELGLTLWGGPGFTLANVVISDIPSVSAEPFAYVTEAHAAIALSSLWRGELTFSRITLTQPSVNIAPLPGGGYNFEQMLHRGVGAGKEAGAALPEIVVESARVNFRSGLEKSIHYFRNADLRIVEEKTGTNAWLVEFRAEPGRTDSFAPRFGTVRGRGRWRPDAGTNGEFDLDVEIERSPLSEIASLFRASRVGLSGYLTARAHLSGPAEDMEIRGRLELSEQGDSPFFLLPQQSSGVALRGNLDLPAGRLHLETGETAAPSPSFSASLDLNPPGSPGRWASALAFDELPVQQVIGLLQYLDDSFPYYPQVRGTLSGQVGFHSGRGLEGEVSGAELSWQEGDLATFRVAGVSIRLLGDGITGSGQLHVEPGEAAPAATPESPSITFALDRRTGAFSATLAGKEIRSTHIGLLRQLAPVVAAPPVTLQQSGWSASGTVSWQRDPFSNAGSWTGDLAVRNLRLPVEGLREDVLVKSASLILRPRIWRMQKARASVTDLAFELDLDFDPGARRPLQLVLRFPELSLRQLDEALTLPSGEQESFLRRTFSLGRPAAPLWLRNRTLSAKVYIEKVLIEDSKYQEMKADLFWDGTYLELRNISAQSRFGPLRAAIRGDFSSSTPSWHWNVQALNPQVQGGEIAMEAAQSATGGLRDIPARISGRGEFTWRRRLRESDSLPSVVRARVDWVPGRREPRICSGCVEVRGAGNVWLGSCNQSNGTGYVCALEDPRTGQKVEINLPISIVGP